MGPEEKVSVEEALRAYTYTPAFLSRLKSGTSQSCAISSGASLTDRHRPDRSVRAVMAGPRTAFGRRVVGAARRRLPRLKWHRPFLTVLTTPVPGRSERLVRDVRGRLRPLIKPGVPLPTGSPYPGHFALVRSVVEGLRAIGADFNFNPRSLGEIARVVYAPANEALRFAGELKREGRIDYLVAVR